MISFEFKYDQKTIASVNNISDLFRKDIWRKFEEVITQQLKSLLIHDLHLIREDLENAGTKITCNFNKGTENFDFYYETIPEVGDKLKEHLRSK